LNVALKDHLRHLRTRGLLYWVSAALLILSGTYVGDLLGRSPCWVDLRYKLYQRQTKSIRPKLYAQRTVIVLVGDDEYWKGELSRRIPIKRDYLAKLIRALDSHNPAIIALDFDLRSPTPNGEPRDNSDYVGETAQLLEAIKDVSHNRPVVVPKTLGLHDGKYFPESDISDGFDFQGGTILRGYIALPFDKRTVPLVLPVQGVGRVDSFAQAIVKADNKEALEGYDGPSYYLPFGTFMKPESFPVVYAKDVVGGVPDSVNKLPFKVVIVGAGWSRLAFERGGKIDQYLTPVGTIGGVFLHANYVEALIGEHIYKPSSERTVRTLDVILAISIAVWFALEINVWWKLGLALLISLGLVLLSYIFLQNLGAFFDFFVPFILVVLHACSERVREWRRAFVQQEARA
jgi:CHASE2 domain-containing sensor protein